MRKGLVGAIVVAVLVAATVSFVVAGESDRKALSPEWPFPPGYHPSEEELEAFEDARNEAEYGDISPAPPPPPPESTPDPEPSPGIVDDPVYPTTEYVFINGWVKRIGKEDINAYAGSLRANPEQGLVLVGIQNIETYSIKFTPYHTPKQAGPVRIISATEDGVLTLRADSGETFTFDVVSGRYT